MKKNYSEVNARVEVAVRRRREEDEIRAAKARERQRQLELEEEPAVENGRTNQAFEKDGGEEDEESSVHFASDAAAANPFKPIREITVSLLP